MLTSAKLDEIHDKIDGTTHAMNDLVTARALKSEEKIEDAISRIQRGLGEIKFAMRGVQADD
jgi:hypothetical protein